MTKPTKQSARGSVSREEALIDAWLEDSGPYVVLNDNRPEHSDDSGTRQVRNARPEAPT
jgi:hypothetical protein